MRTKPTRQQLDKVVGRRLKPKKNTTAAVIRHVMASDRTLLQQALSSDYGRMGRLVARMPETPLTTSVKRQSFDSAVQPPASSRDVVPFSGEGRSLEALNLFPGAGVPLPRRGRGQAIIERGLAQAQRNQARLEARRR
jgi:hypothetical protein